MKKPDPNQLASQFEQRPATSLADWNPPLSGVMNLRIARDGTWYHEGRAIQRSGLIRLFASILRLEADGHYYLVTPVEKWRIQVDAAPFTAVELVVESSGANQTLSFWTNVGDYVTVDSDHPITVDYAQPQAEPEPYVTVRGQLRALITRSVFVELAELAIIEKVEGHSHYGVYSQGLFFPLGRTE